jgi:single-stranded-DNA-specific exonuclease
MKYRLRDTYSSNPDKAIKDLLQGRGVKDIRSFLHPTKDCELDPHKLKNIDAAAEKLLYHLRKNSDILFIVDADCDGFTSSAILWLYIKQIFPDARLEFTVHEHKQHGLNDKIDWISNEAKWDLVICPDAGSYDVNEHRALKDLGIDIICLDHHDQLYDDQGNPVISNVSNAIIVNNQLSPDYSNKSLCGAGITYKFCEVLDEILGIKQAQNYIDLAALGEIADVMDRTNIETNYIMLEGLKNIKNGGLKALLKSQESTPSLKDRAKPPYIGLTPIDIAFYIAPLINAITRIGSITEKETMFYCFIEPYKPMQSTKRGAKIGDIETAAEQTARVGKNAKARQDRLKEQAMSIIDFKIQKDGLDENNIILIELDICDNIPQELTGLIAMNVVSKYHKPVMIGRRNSSNEIQGSIRSDGNFAGLPSFKKFLEDSGLVTYTAGHDNAAGWGLNGDKLDALIKYANKNLKAEDFENCYVVDYILDGNNYNEELLLELAEHPEYFGNHIEEPTVVITDIPLMNIMAMGANKDSMKISYNGVDYVKFKDEDFVEEITNNRAKKLTVYGRPNLNEWMGKKSIQVFITDYELVEDNSKYDF